MSDQHDLGIGSGSTQETENEKVDGIRSDLDINMRILLPSKVAGAIIGKGGANIKRLRTDYKAIVNLPDSKTSERILSVSSKLDVACAIVRDVIPTISQKMNRGGDNDHEVRLLVEETFVGRIIGKGGVAMKDLREKSGSRVMFYTGSAPYSSERVMQIVGSIDQIAKCIGILHEGIEGAKVDGIPMWYDAINAAPQFAVLYGGFTKDDDNAKPKGGVAAFGTERFEDTSTRGGACGVGMSGHLDLMQQSQSGGKAGKILTTQITIPKGLAGAILGKGGCHIKQVQQESGTKIKLEEVSADSAERIVIITGTKDQIEKAQKLIQVTVKKNSGPSPQK